MSPEDQLIDKLTKLNHIAETLNRAVDVRGVLDDVLADLVQLMGLDAGWIFLKDAESQGGGGNGYRLAAHWNLPPALDASNAELWQPGCACQRLLDESGTGEAYNAVGCSRLGAAEGDRGGLAVHASAVLRSGDRVLGILNAAAPDWSSFNPPSLALLTTVGSQIGIALERARLYDLLREQRVQEQAALLSFTNQLLGRLDLGDVVHYLVRQVRQILGADASALLLPGEEAGLLDFRAASGWRADPVAEHRQMHADAEIGPAPAMRTLQPHLVEDMEQSDMAPYLPEWLRAEGFHGLASVPLLVEGRSVGLLTVQMRQPRLLDEGELRLLQLLANQAAIAIESARLHESEVKGQALEREMELGREIQLSLLPRKPPALPGWELAVYYQPARQVGGDFYDFVELPDAPGRLGVVVADVMGKGVPAALFMALGRTVIRTIAQVEHSPGEVLTRANPVIYEDSRSSLFLTALYAVLDTRSGRLVYANAGHNRPLWQRAASGEIRELEAKGIALGVLREIELEECAIDVAPGDALILYTDGVTEAMDAGHSQFGRERLRAAIEACAGEGAQQMVESIVRALEEFSGQVQQSDDITIVVARALRNEPAAARSK